MKRELYAILKNDKFVEAAYCTDEFTDEADRYVRLCERKYGLKGLSYKWGDQAKKLLPEGYEARIFVPKMTKDSKKRKDVFSMYRKIHDQDDGVNYE